MSHIKGEVMHLSRKQKDLREKFIRFLDTADEDKFTENLLVPLFKKLGFERVSIAGHKDKHLEFGKDVWMVYDLPTQHKLFVGVQVKVGRIHSSGSELDKNIGGILSQLLMMLFYPVFDTQTNSKHLIDHIYLVSSGEITKQARTFLTEFLDNGMRRNVLFLDREELIDLCMKYGETLAVKLGMETEALTNGEFNFDKTSRVMIYKGKQVELTPNESLVMELFFNRPNIVITHEEILEQLHGEIESGKEPAKITRPVISRLRDQLEIIGVRNQIKTTRGVGYAFKSEKKSI